MKRQVIVIEVLGEKKLSVGGIELLSNTKEMREKVENLDINPEEHKTGEIVGEIKL